MIRPKRRIRKSQRAALRLPWKEYDEIWDYIERFEKAARKVIDRGLYQPESADVLEEALKGEVK